MSFISSLWKGGSAAIRDWFSPDLEPIPALSGVKKVSVRLGSEEDREEALDKYVFENSTSFDPVPFIVQDETGKGKKALLSCKVVSGRGFVVHELGDKDNKFMTLALLKLNEEEHTDVVAELYNANRNLSSRFFEMDDYNILITRPEESKEEKKGKLEIEVRGNPFLKIGKAIHVLNVFDTDSYRLVLGGTVVAEVFPKIRHKSYVVEFSEHCNGEKPTLKNLALAVALWLMITKAFIPMGNLLRESMKGKPFQELEELKAIDEALEAGDAEGDPNQPEKPSKSCCVVQ